MDWLIVVGSILFASLVGELYWKKMRKKGHKDLWELLSERFKK